MCIFIGSTCECVYPTVECNIRIKPQENVKSYKNFISIYFESNFLDKYIICKQEPIPFEYPSTSKFFLS